MKIHHLHGYIQAIYLVEYPDKLLLLDGCCRCDVPMVLDFIENVLCRSRFDLKLVVVTHLHPDHAGGANLFKKLTQCQIASQKLPQQWYGGLAGLAMYSIDTSLAWYVAYRQGKGWRNLAYSPYLYPDVVVKGGDYLPDFPDWQVIDTAGHTDRDISLWHADTGQIYVADVVVKLKHKYVAPFPIYEPATYRQTLQKIRALQPKQILLAHGGRQVMEDKLWQQFIETAPKQARTVTKTVQHKLMGWQRHLANEIEY